MENFNIDDYIDDRITIYSTDDPNFGHIEVCEGYYLGDHMRFLLVDDAMQSANFTDEGLEAALPFDYMESFNWVYRINKHIKKTLLIGGGGFTYPRYYLDMYPDRYIDAIEISPTIVNISRKYFGLTELEEKYGEHLKVIVEDGNKYLIDLALRINASANAESLKYDLILNDAYLGHKSSDLLKKSAALIKSCLKEDGIYAANLVIPLKGNGAVQPKKDMEIFSEVFNYTFLLQCDDEINPYVPQNCIFFASDAPLDM